MILTKFLRNSFCESSDVKIVSEGNQLGREKVCIIISLYGTTARI